MRSQLRAFAVLGGSSLATLLISLVSMKAYALMIGPSGVGRIGIVQGLASMTALLAGFGAGTGVVRLAAPMLAEGRTASALRLFTQARGITLAACAVTLACALVLRENVAAVMLGDSSWTGTAIVGVVSGLLIAWATLELGVLNAHHAVGDIARATIAGATGAALIGIGLIWRNGVAGVPAAILFGQFWIAGVATVLSRRVTSARAGAEAPGSAPDASALVTFGAAYTLSMVLGVGVQYALPALVVNRLGLDAAGHVRAALTISTAYLAVFLAAMARDYYPRVCAATSVEELNRIVNTQLGILLLLGTPLVLLLQVTSPIALSLLFSKAFTPAVDVLRWQLVGELFKFASWTFAFVILGRLPSRHYLLSEATAGVTLLVGVSLLLSSFGIASVGLGYAFSYCCYFIATLVLVWPLGVRVTPANSRYLGAALAAAVGIALLQTVSDRGSASVVAQVVIAGTALALAARAVVRSGLASGGLAHLLRLGRA